MDPPGSPPPSDGSGEGGTITFLPGEGGTEASAPLSCNDTIPGRATARLLTRLQYRNTMRDLLSDWVPAAVVDDATRAFPDESTFLGFGNNADVHRASLVLIEQHTEAAQQLAEAAISGGGPLSPSCPASQGDCVGQFVSEFGTRAFRRPPSSEEAAGFESLYAEAATQWGENTGLQVLLQAILQAPQVLYRTESFDRDGSEPTDSDGQSVPLDSFQVAARLSYFLWNTLPDSTLLRLAQEGSLLDRTTVEQQARRMLADPRARTTVADFFGQWLGTSRFSGLARQQQEGGEILGTHNAAWKRSLEQFVQYAFWEEGGTLDALLTSDAVFFEDPETAALYDLPASDIGQPVRAPNRAGLITQPGLLSLLSHPDQSAPILRGKFVREQLLCQPLLPPPPTVDASPPDPDPNATTRERFAQHTGNDACSGCHRLIDGIGFGLEGFDQMGRFRSEENGLVIDTRGDIQGSLDPELNGTFSNAAELSQRLAGSSQVQDCVATQWFRYAMGRAEQNEDSCSLDSVKRQFQDSGGDFRELFVALATTDVFRFRVPNEQDL